MFWDKPTIRQFFREQGNWPELRIRNGERRTAMLKDPGQPEDPDVLAEIERRRRQWLAPRDDNRPAMPMAIDILLTGAIMGILSLIAEKGVLQVGLLIALAFLFIRICIVVRRRQRVQEALIDGLCPDCGYDCGLEGAGPPVCPECGYAWPLVPPARRRRGGHRPPSGPPQDVADSRAA